MKETKTTIKYKCDLCGKECLPVRSLSLPYSSFMDLTNTIELDIKAHIPYGTLDGDVCRECLIKCLKKFIDGL